LKLKRDMFLLRILNRILRAIVSTIMTLVVLGLSLLPLSALLLAFPALDPQESVLEDTVSKRSFLGSVRLRLFALLTGLAMLIAQFAVSLEITSRLPLPDRGPYVSIARGFLPAPSVMLGKTEREREEKLAAMPAHVRDFMKTPLHSQLPAAMVQHWPVFVLILYATDIALLFFLGKVPFSYNLRNLRVRWLTNAMTALAFVFVIGLLVFLLAFVNGMNDLTENTGIPGNVFVLSDGSTDELFSNLGYGDIDNVDKTKVDLDSQDAPIPVVSVKSINRGGRAVALASKETYYVINQPIPNSNPPRRRFVQLRTVEDPFIAQAVHDIQLQPGGEWFEGTSRSPIQCVLGDGIARTLGADVGKPSLVAGDAFTLGDVEWVITGVMKSEGTTFGSEIWCYRSNLIYNPFGKEKHTTLVLRTDRNTLAAARAYAWHLNTRYTQQKLKAFAEPDYYAELTKTNNDFLTAIVFVAVVMAIGGVFGMMTTMFASIAQRIRDIGVLRLLGFKRWQILVSFMIESLAIALAGGLAGCLIAWLFVDGRSSTSTLSGGGGGGGKNFAITISVSLEVMALGLLFAMMMGRLGGLVPALSAMRAKILDTLR
jgi:ABC-type antimicrobial peptide transport system permease subunit